MTNRRKEWCCFPHPYYKLILRIREFRAGRDLVVYWSVFMNLPSFYSILSHNSYLCSESNMSPGIVSTRLFICSLGRVYYICRLFVHFILSSSLELTTALHGRTPKSFSILLSILDIFIWLKTPQGS